MAFTGLVSCSNDSSNDDETETVKVTLIAATSTETYTIEKGKTISDIPGYTEPTKEGWTFKGWLDSEGNLYSTSKQITSDITLSANFSKNAKTETNGDGSTTTTTESESADGSKSKTEVTKDKDGKTIETKTTTTKADGSTVTETVSDGKTIVETVNADKTSSTKTEETNSAGETVTTTVEKDSGGNVTKTTEVTESEDGKVVTKVTDASGKTTTTVSTKAYKQYIDEGIKALENENPDFDLAVSKFNQAYETEANDETRVYSALASLASISAKKETADFMKKHLGIVNYPSKMNALFSPDWLNEAEYIDYEEEEYVGGYSEFTKKSPYEKTSNLYGVSFLRESELYESSSSSEIYYKCSVEKLDSYEDSGVYYIYIYKQENVGGTTAYFELNDLKNYQKRVNGFSEIGEYYKVTLDENGEYYVSSFEIGSEVDTSSFTKYAYDPSKSIYVDYTYEDKTDTDYSGFYRCKITPTNSYDSEHSVGKGALYKKVTINNTEFYADLYDIADYEKNTTGSTNYTSDYYTYTLDENGEYFVRIDKGSGTELSSATAYESDYNNSVYEYYTYNVKTKFAKLDVPSWFKNSSLNNNLGALLLANILEGNTKGLNDALEDFYNVVFGSEYNDACEKLDAITKSVKVPSNVIDDFGLSDIVGSYSVRLGPSELGLIKTAFNVLKATVEYAEAYNLNSDLSFLKIDWNNETAIKNLYEKYLSYDSSIDPLKNGFMSLRSQEKMDLSKEDFSKAIGDLIASYDEIISNTSDYPSVLTDTLSEYKILKEGAEKLKDAISNGGKFYIPEDISSISTWPTSGLVYIDLGKLFDASNFALSNFIDNKDGKPKIYNLSYDDYEDGYVESKEFKYWNEKNNWSSETITLSSSVLDAENAKKILEAVGSNFEAYDNTFALKINLSPLSNVVSGVDFSSLKSNIQNNSAFCQLGFEAGLYVFNFYNNGAISEALKTLVSN